MSSESKRSISSRSRRAACAVALSLGLIVAACGEAPVEEAPVVRPIKMMTVGSGDAARLLEYPGEVSAVQNAELAFEVAGRIVEFLVEEGQRVEAGTMLARLDDRNYQAELDSAKAFLRKARGDFARERSIYQEDPGATTQAALETYRRAVEVSEAGYRQAEKAFEDTELRAPFSGVMARKLVDDFQNVSARDPVLILQDDSSLEIKVSVPEADLALGGGAGGRSLADATARFKPVVVVTTFPDRRFPARFTEFTTTADPVTRTFEATFAFENPPDVSVLPGMTAKAILTPPREASSGAVEVPVHAVAADETGAPFVWVVDPDSMRVRRTLVELGDLTGSRTGILSGLAHGDLIATSGVNHLREGMQVSLLEK
jgi:RND family efflux transporter MFP subunit